MKIHPQIEENKMLRRISASKWYWTSWWRSFLGGWDVCSVPLQEGRTPHAGRSNAPKYTARHSSALHWQAVGCLSTWNIFRTSIFHPLFCICVCTILVLYLYGMCWGSSVGAIKICHLIMALPDPAESQQWGLDWTRWWCAQCGNKLRINKPPLANNTFSWSWQVHAVPQYLRKGQL